MKEKCELLLFTIIAISIMFTGCSRKNSSYDSGSKEALPYHIEKTLDTNLGIDADVIEPNFSSLPTYTAHIFEPSYEQVQGAFFSEFNLDDLSIVRRTVAEDGEYGFGISYDKRRSFNYGGYQLYMNYDYLYYYQLITYYPDSLFKLPPSLENASIKDAGDLSFMSKEEALTLTRNTSSLLGLSLEEEPFACIALTPDNLTTLYQYVGGNPDLFYSNEDISFEDDEGCYYIVWNQKSENGESIFSENYSANTLSGVGNCRGSYILAIVNKEGIVSFETPMNYAITEKKSNENIIDVDAALACVKKKYSNLILNEPITITKIYFCYSYSLIDKNSLTYAFLPTWCILSHNSADDSYSLTTINAVTGTLF